MALRNDPTSSDIGYGLSPATFTVSACVWLKHDGTGMSNDRIFGFDTVDVRINGSGFTIQLRVAGTPVADVVQKIIPNQWMFCGLTMNLSEQHVYLKPAIQPGFTNNQVLNSATGAGGTSFQSFGGGASGWHGMYSNVKFWDGTLLSREQMDLESSQLAPVFMNGIYGWLRFQNGIVDARGINDAVSGGSGEEFYADEPPVPLRRSQISLVNPIWAGKGTRKWLLGAH